MKHYVQIEGEKIVDDVAKFDVWSRWNLEKNKSITKFKKKPWLSTALPGFVGAGLSDWPSNGPQMALKWLSSQHRSQIKYKIYNVHALVLTSSYTKPLVGSNSIKLNYTEQGEEKWQDDRAGV